MSNCSIHEIDTHGIVLLRRLQCDTLAPWHYSRALFERVSLCFRTYLRRSLSLQLSGSIPDALLCPFFVTIASGNTLGQNGKGKPTHLRFQKMFFLSLCCDNYHAKQQTIFYLITRLHAILTVRTPYSNTTSRSLSLTDLSITTIKYSTH